MDKFLLVLQLEDKERNLLDGICLGTYGYRILTHYYKHYRNYNIQFQLDHLYKEGFCGIYHNNILKKFLNYTWKKKLRERNLLWSIVSVQISQSLGWQFFLQIWTPQFNGFSQTALQTNGIFALHLTICFVLPQLQLFEIRSSHVGHGPGWHNNLHRCGQPGLTPSRLQILPQLWAVSPCLYTGSVTLPQ